MAPQNGQRKTDSLTEEVFVCIVKTKQQQQKATKLTGTYYIK